MFNEEKLRSIEAVFFNNKTGVDIYATKNLRNYSEVCAGLIFGIYEFNKKEKRYDSPHKEKFLERYIVSTNEQREIFITDLLKSEYSHKPYHFRHKSLSAFFLAKPFIDKTDLRKMFNDIGKTLTKMKYWNKSSGLSKKDVSSLKKRVKKVITQYFDLKNQYLKD